MQHSTKLHITKVEEIVILDVSGQKFDASFAIHLKKEVQPLLKDSSQMILNLEDVNFLDSTGLGALVYLQKKLQESSNPDRFLKLTGVKTEINRLFQLAKMDKVFQQYTTIHDALEDTDPSLVDKYMDVVAKSQAN